MYCKKCGFELPNDAKFCSKCGTEVMLIKESAIINETKISSPLKSNKNLYVIKDIKLIKFAFWIIQILTWLLVLYLFILFVINKSTSGLMLGGGIIFILLFLANTFSLIKNYPKSLLVDYKAITGFDSFCGGITIFNGVILIGAGVFAGSFIINEMMHRFSGDTGFLVVIAYNLVVVLYGISLIYYPTRAFKILGTQKEIKLDLTLIKVKHNFSNNIEEVSLRKWNEMKKEFGEDNYEIVEDE